MKHAVVKRIMAILFGAGLALIFSSNPAAAQCPSAAQVGEGFQKLIRHEVTVLKVQPSQIAGLCEVQFKISGPIEIAYVDPTGNYFVTGHILDAQTQVDLTKEAAANLNRLTAEDFKTLDSLVAFTAGKSSKFIYYVTDPKCPFCKKGEEILNKMIDDGKLSVKFILYPLPMHKGADEESIAIICDKKGLKELETGYSSANQCAEGKKKVKDAIAFMNEKHFTGTPIYIFPNGLYHLGVMEPDAILKNLSTPEKK
jgi:thiol:disulfide interchange protein DsbC